MSDGIKGFKNSLVSTFGDVWRAISPKAQARAEWKEIDSFGWNRGRKRVPCASMHPEQAKTEWEGYYAVIEGRSPEDVQKLRALLGSRGVNFQEGSTASINRELLGDHPAFLVGRASILVMHGHISIKDDETMKPVVMVRQASSSEAPDRPAAVHRRSASRILAGVTITHSKPEPVVSALRKNGTAAAAVAVPAADPASDTSGADEANPPALQ